jgi:NAD-dependent DNA ligase
MQDKKNPVNTSDNPDYAVAFKMASEGNEVVAEVVRVEWNASKHGFLKPRCEIKPVRLAGVTVKFATCHNAAFVRDNGIGPGAQVKITRSGEVIPYILEVVKKVKPSLPSVKEFGDWEWNETEVDIVLADPVANDSVAVKQVTHFFRTLGVENFGEGLVARFYDSGFDTIEKIIKMKKSDMMKVEGIQDRMAAKIYNNIQEALEDVYLPSIMDASGIFGRNFGTRRIEGIMDEYYPEVMGWGKQKPELIKKKILRIAGFKDTLADQFAKNLGKFIEWFDKLGLDFHYNEGEEEVEQLSSKLEDQRIYITGFRDAELSELIEKHGGEETSGFNSKTTVLIVKDKSTSNTKTDNAKKAGVPVLTKEEFIKKFKL